MDEYEQLITLNDRRVLIHHEQLSRHSTEHKTRLLDRDILKHPPYVFHYDDIIKTIKYMIYKFVKLRIFNNSLDILIPIALVNDYDKYHNTYEKNFSPNEFTINFNNGLSNVISHSPDVNIMAFINYIANNTEHEEFIKEYTEFITGYTINTHEKYKKMEISKISYHLSLFLKNLTPVQ